MPETVEEIGFWEYFCCSSILEFRKKKNVSEKFLVFGKSYLTIKHFKTSGLKANIRISVDNQTYPKLLGQSHSFSHVLKYGASIDQTGD